MQPKAEAFPFEDSEIVQSAKETVQGAVESALETIEEGKDAIFQKVTELYEGVNQWIADTREEIQEEVEHDYNEYASGSESEKQEMDGTTDDGMSALDYSGTVSAERAEEIARELNKHQGIPEGVNVVGVQSKENATTGERETFVAIIDKENLEGEQRVTVLSIDGDGRFQAVSELNLQENGKEMQELYDSIIHDNARIEENYENSKTIGEKMEDDWLFRLAYLSGFVGMGIGLKEFLKKYDEITGKVKSVADTWYNEAREVNETTESILDRIRDTVGEDASHHPIFVDASINFSSQKIDSNFHKYTKKIKPIEGYDDVVCHSTNTQFHIKVDQNPKHNYKMNAKEFAKRIQNSPLYHGGNIRLICCNSGERELAQELSNVMKVSVLAPTTKVCISSHGKLFLTDDLDKAITFFRYGTGEEDGKWIEFFPEGDN